MTSIDSRSSDLLSALALAKLLNDSQQSAGPEAETLDRRIRTAIGGLVSAQRDDGAWSWCGVAAKSFSANRYLSSRIVWALGCARQAGYKVPDEAMQKGIGYLKTALAKVDNADNESRAILVHARSEERRVGKECRSRWSPYQ